MGNDGSVSSVAGLRTIYRQPGQASLDKEVDHLDAHCRDFLAHTPFAVLASSNGRGRVDASPKGGPPGFLAVLDEHHLAVPDMAGNNRLDSLQNIVACPAVSLLCMVPGVGETLRVVGTATVSTTAGILERCRIDTLVPNVAVVVQVKTAYIHCAKALRRSGLWQPDLWPDTSGMASTACMMRDHMALPDTTEQMQEFLDEAYEQTTWAMGGRPAG